MSQFPLPGSLASATDAPTRANEVLHGASQRRSFIPLFILCWFGLNLALGSTSGAAIPKFFAFLDDETKATNLSIVAAIGGIVVMVTTPLFGRLSDRTMSRLGIRRPWILGGAIVGLLGITVLAFSNSLAMVIIGWSITQAGFGATNAAVHALLADQIPRRIRARVSAGANAGASIALIVGAVLIATLPNDQQWTWFIVPGGVAVITSVLLFFGLRDIVRTSRPEPLRWLDIVSTYWLDPVKYRDFFWAWMCRLLVTMSILSVSTYLLYFIIDELKVPKEEASGVLATAILAFTIAGIFTTVLGAWASDKIGKRKPFIWISCMLSAAGLLLTMFAHDVPMLLLALAAVGAAQGAYGSVDIALMTEVLPTFDDAGKDLGIVALSYQLPQLLVPILAVPLLAIGGGGNYTALYITAIVFCVLGGLAVLPIRSVK